MSQEIVYLSSPAPVSMGDFWFEIATTDHFWIRRRFEVLKKLTSGIDWPRLKSGEIGCGNGLVQRQFEDYFGAQLDGFDLNEKALLASVSRSSTRYCYNIYDCAEAVREAYDTLLFFDVLEHIDDHQGFLEKAHFHLKPGGFVLINVPALPELFSMYDTAAGHVRRYHSEDLISLVESAGFKSLRWTYWGKPMLPLLRIRTRRLKHMKNADTVLRDGFDSRGTLANAALLALSRLEFFPEHEKGTSLMLLAERPA